MVCSHHYAGFRPWRLKSLRSMEFIRWYKFKNLSQWGTRPEVCQIYVAVPHVLFLALSFSLLRALFIPWTLLFNTNSVFFSRFSSFERLPSITVVFPRTFHHLYASLWCFTALFVIWTLLFNNSGVFPRFSSSERFSSTSAAFAALFIVCKFSRSFYHLHFPCAFPPFVPRCAFPFFSSFAHTSHSLSFSRTFCHSRLLHPSLYLRCHKTAEIKLRYLAFLAWERVDTSRRHHFFFRDGWTSETNFHPIRSTTQIWLVWRHQYEISALVSQTSLRWETLCGVRKGRLFFKAKFFMLTYFV